MATPTKSIIDMAAASATNKDGDMYSDESMRKVAAAMTNMGIFASEAERSLCKASDGCRIMSFSPSETAPLMASPFR